MGVTLNHIKSFCLNLTQNGSHPQPYKLLLQQPKGSFAQPYSILIVLDQTPEETNANVLVLWNKTQE